MIIESAIRLFVEKGAETTRIQEIAESAGIGKSTFYEYFPDKAELVCFWVETVFVRMEQDFELDGDASASQQLATIVRVACSNAYCTPEFMTMFLEFWRLALNEKHPKAMELMQHMYSGYNQMASALISQGIAEGAFRDVDPDKMASAYLGGIDGLWIQYMVNPQTYDLSAHAEVYLENFLRGIAKETE